MWTGIYSNSEDCLVPTGDDCGEFKGECGDFPSHCDGASGTPADGVDVELELLFEEFRYFGAPRMMGYLLGEDTDMVDTLVADAVALLQDRLNLALHATCLLAGSDGATALLEVLDEPIIVVRSRFLGGIEDGFAYTLPGAGYTPDKIYLNYPRMSEVVASSYSWECAVARMAVIIWHELFHLSNLVLWEHGGGIGPRNRACDTSFRLADLMNNLLGEQGLGCPPVVYSSKKGG